MRDVLLALNQLINSIFEFTKEVSTPQSQSTLFPGGVFTILGTIISGVIVFVACEWAREEWLTPYQEYKKIKSKIAFTLEFYAHCYLNVVDYTQKNERYDKGREEMRKLACDLAGFMETISFFRMKIPDDLKLKEAHSALIGLSNGFYSNTQEKSFAYITSNKEFARTVIENLKLKSVTV